MATRLPIVNTAPPPRVEIRRGYPAGPSLVRRIATGQIFRYDAIDFLRANVQHYGDLVHFRAGSRHVYQINHPALIQQSLVADAPHHHRGLVMQRARFVLGDGMLTSEEPLHLRQRRLTQPAFHRDRIAGYGAVIGDCALRMTQGWHSGTTLDLHGEMLLLTLRIVGKCLFNADVDSDVRKISAAVDAFMGFLPLAFLPFSDQLLRLPLPVMKRISRGQAELDALIYQLIRERRASGVDQGDLLSMLLATVDEEEQTGGMSDRQVRDECLTLLLAGHETTANALSFALWLAASHPEWQERLHEEATSALSGDAAIAADYPNLPLAWQHFAEAMRLYPPVWVTARTAAESYEFAGVTIPTGALIIAPQIVVHHDARWWRDPDAFHPERFAGQAPAHRTSAGNEGARDEAAARPKLAYFPFGAGTRQCIGEGFSWMEGVLALATILRDWRMSVPPSHPATLPVVPRITLRPKKGLPLHLERR